MQINVVAVLSNKNSGFYQVFTLLLFFRDFLDQLCKIRMGYSLTFPQNFPDISPKSEFSQIFPLLKIIRKIFNIQIMITTIQIKVSIPHEMLEHNKGLCNRANTSVRKSQSVLLLTSSNLCDQFLEEFKSERFYWHDCSNEGTK